MQSSVPCHLAPFSQFTQLLESIAQKCARPSGTALRTIAQQLISQWFDTFAEQGGDLFSVIRLLLPQEDVTRKYQVKETRLAQALVKGLGLSGTRRGQQLLSWRTSAEKGDLSIQVSQLIENTLPTNQKWSIADINRLLDELSLHYQWQNLANIDSGTARASRHHRPMESILLDLFQKTSSIEAKWMTRLLLRDLRLAVLNDPRTVLLAVHEEFSSLYNIQYHLPTACATMKRFLESGSTKLLPWQPILGIPIAIQACGRATSVRMIVNQHPNSVLFVETKYDGERFQLHWQASGSRQLIIYSKSRRDSTVDRLACHSQIRAALGHDATFLERHGVVRTGPALQDCILEGEILVFDEENKIIEPFGSVSLLAPGKESSMAENRHFILVLFDVLQCNGRILLREPLSSRRAILQRIITEIPEWVQVSEAMAVDTRDANQAMQTLCDLFQDSQNRREEGLVIKNADAPYLPHNRTAWFKLKRDYVPGLGDSADFALVGARYGTGARTLGLLSEFAVACRLPTAVHDFAVVFSVETGLSDDERRQLHDYLQPLCRPLDHEDLTVRLTWMPGTKKSDVVFTRPLVASLLGASFVKERGSSHYVLRFPRIVRIHQDRDLSECVRFDQLQEWAKKSVELQEDEAPLQMKEALLSSVKEKRTSKFDLTDTGTTAITTTKRPKWDAENWSLKGATFYIACVPPNDEEMEELVLLMKDLKQLDSLQCALSWSSTTEPLVVLASLESSDDLRTLMSRFKYELQKVHFFIF